MMWKRTEFGTLPFVEVTSTHMFTKAKKLSPSLLESVEDPD